MTDAHYAMPDKRLFLSDFPRATKETFSLVHTLFGKNKTQYDALESMPVLLFPGYGGGDGSMQGLKYFLTQLGLQCYGLDLGRNIESKDERIKSVDDATRYREKMTELISDRLVDIHQQTGRKVVLLGWSMGGCFALDVSQTHAEKVAMVITLGSPFGDPRGTSTWPVLRFLNQSKVPIESMNFYAWLEKARVKTQGVPIRVLYSEQDGIVGKQTAMLPEHPDVEHTVIASSHIGFAYNPEVYARIYDLLRQQQDNG